MQSAGSMGNIPQDMEVDEPSRLPPESPGNTQRWWDINKKTYTYWSMDELMDLMIADDSPSEVSDAIKNALYQKRKNWIR